MTIPQTFMDDQAMVERVLAHVRAGTTDLGDEVWREPVENYRSEERFQREIALLRRLPVPFCPSAALREPGAFVARSAAGAPILAVRGEGGQVLAFRNACRHRGAEVASGTGCARTFVCPYHGWTYGLDGRLQRVHQESGFPDLDKGAHGLVPVRAQERSGIVFVTQSEEADEHDPGEGLPELIGQDQEVIDTHDNETDVNWKISIEGAIEGYHIRFCHPDTFYPYGYDNLNIVEHCGRNSRVTFPFRRIEKLADVPAAERQIEGRVTYVYHLFPNALVTVLSHHTILVVLEPIAPGRTRSVAYSLAHTGGDAAAAETAKRDASFVTQTGAPEDRALAESVQRNVASEANEFFTFGHFESAIVHFHKNLQAALDESERGRSEA
ncbi:MAG: aromatic ring-hydroxylating dioxygenase subunit alpha [Deltaproteobacteria bacterium]|jgi:phenylpropionate dioxygenase-like ring-hydroxylating dioxygenase large terminal subunit|nr:aromatic ring-hydroxylating dioxygenase subunit alpha [Deltaproteobacteria bacterium]